MNSPPPGQGSQAPPAFQGSHSPNQGWQVQDRFRHPKGVLPETHLLPLEFLWSNAQSDPAVKWAAVCWV